MKKVFTFFCALMVCVLFSGVANAQSPVEFQTSSEPTSAGFAENTHWYIMKLKNMFVTIENVDGENNIKLTEDNTLTNTYITSDADQWCIVGDAASGYKFYNKKAGVDKVFGMSNLTSTNQSESNYTEYGKSRAQMHDKGTTSSSAEGGIGTIFEIRTKDAPLTDYYIRLKDANVTNRYLNSRGGYIGYWAKTNDNGEKGGYGDGGSKVQFYKADSYWTDYWASIDYTAYENLATQMETLVGTTPFTSYPETAVNAFKNAIAEVKSFKPTDKISIYKALNVTNYLNDAKWILRKSINGPKTDGTTIYKLVNNHFTTYFVHAPLNWNNDKLILANTNDDRGIGWVFEPGSTSGSYKIKSADTGMYIKGTGSFSTTANSSDATDYFIAAYTEGGTSTVAIGVSNNIESHNWFHVNTGSPSILAWSGSAGASAWNIVEINDADFAALTDTRTTSMLLLPGVSGNEAVNTALTTYNTVKFRTVENWNLLVNTVNKVLNDKYYRINNKRSNRTLLATDGVDKPQMKTIADEKLVSCIWKFELDKNSGGYKLTNVNTPGKYVAVLLAAPAEANAFTTSENADIFTLSVEGDHFLIRNKDNHLMNGEEQNTQTYPINYWDDNRFGGTKWQITELNSFTIDLHTAADTKSYASVYLPFSVSGVTGAKAYVAKNPETNTVTFSLTEEGVKAQNGFLLISETGATATLNIGESNITSAMGGTLLDRTLNEADKVKLRVFGQKTGDEKVIGFFKPSAQLNTISANRAFFTNATGEALRLNFDGMVSGIETTELNNVLNNNAPIYDLSGRRVMNAVKGGLYIQNGRKFIVK